MTRFFFTIDDALRLIDYALWTKRGGIVVAHAVEHQPLESPKHRSPRRERQGEDVLLVTTEERDRARPRVE